MVFLGAVGREWALALDDVCSGVNVCVCVSLPALV